MIPKRLSVVLGVTLLIFLSVFLVNGILAEKLIDAADVVFAKADSVIEEGTLQPTDPLRAGSKESLIDWDTIGRRGKNFVAQGPTADDISKFSGTEALNPLRAYVGFRTRDTDKERAELLLAEMQRINAFERSVLVIATPTGTGWIDAGAVDTLEYMHDGDTAYVGAQYSFLPSWPYTPC